MGQITTRWQNGVASMSTSDSYLRTLRERRKRVPAGPVDVPAAPSTPKPGLVSQGGRSAGMPIGRTKTPDDLIREARGDRSVWTRIA